jgi:catechol 2,3-dioxygenase-like lactoylglutathione lyase family enzyme
MPYAQFSWLLAPGFFDFRLNYEVNFMDGYVDSGEQLVVAIYVRDMKESREFYLSYGFEVVRDEGTFMELRWEEARLFLSEVPGTPPPPPIPIGNMRVMVPNVDEYWALANKMGAKILSHIEDQYYGLRDFIIAGPDGLALRFATWLKDLEKR